MRFFSISNHPVSKWPDAQKKAALELGGEIREIPFPSPSADASNEDISKSADLIAAQVPDEAIAMVHGENTTAYAIAKRLRARGLRVVAPKHSRQEQSETQEEKIVKTSVFIFLGWWDYE